MAGYQAHLSALEANDVQVIAASVDSRADAQALIETLGLTFPVAFGLDYRAFAAQTGAFYEMRRGIIHATTFVLRTDGTVAHAVYATGPAGRLSGEDAVRVTA